ncbi:GNAT family N-acetyltransferase [Alicyclobacillus sp. ALC3]|uniref:GNAT family N-acetyltransferase n=1 Tax=Alicyclobacillus sp. ALC3 TaxID=2796143 RepID=UPI002379A571|nr:GNAT family N-acetyltransferase [Alicyclobacillus sp. ALC3]WDL95960.1 GNAT family N-acetyltransferase [Alicyclobacillus sp. ALC3]
MEIRLDDMTDSQVIALIGQHLRSMEDYSPAASIHALDLDNLRRPDITFWTVWEGDELLGCGALKDLGGGHGEVKSMRTATAHLRKGVARYVLQHIVAEARQRGYYRLSLETGSNEAFDPAKKLYATFGFELCRPFADYQEDPYSVFMTMEL